MKQISQPKRLLAAVPAACVSMLAAFPFFIINIISIRISRLF
ncbi:hypothetical protein [Aquicella lusitana]|nr:hypothetical protein [Aquicella lusitana]